MVFEVSFGGPFHRLSSMSPVLGNDVAPQVVGSISSGSRHREPNDNH